MSPDQLLQNLIMISPDFRAYWLAAGNYRIDQDGTFTVHGVFSEFSGFVMDHAGDLSDDDYRRIGEFVSECNRHGLNSDIGNAAATCFIENLSGENPSSKLKPYLQGEALKFFLFWNPER